jgi:hypothetical protein
VVHSCLLTGDPLTVPVLLGAVGLAGVAVNDSIVLIDFANARVKRGLTPMAAVREAAQLRLRPLVLTTITTTAGLFPSAIGLGPSGRSVVWGPMATAFSFGLVSATTLTLIATPTLYLLADDVMRASRWLRRLFGSGSADADQLGSPNSTAATPAPTAPPKTGDDTPREHSSESLDDSAQRPFEREEAGTQSVSESRDGVNV